MAVAIPWVVPVVKVRDRVKAKAAEFQSRVKRLSRVGRARAGYGSGLLCTAWGVGVVFGFGWALIAGGVAASWSFLTLYDVDEPS